MVAEIKVDMVRAMAEGDETWMDELTNQLKAVAEANRLRAVHATWDTVSDIVLSFLRFGGKALAAAV